ncbi:MAG: GWxTD domain-containing protein [Patescibacteria group bacterium]
MKRSRMFILFYIVLLLFIFGCASSGNKKPIVFVNQYSNVPDDIPSQFLNRYEHFITGKEQKEFKKLLTDEDRQMFIDMFWTKRDTDPSTPENEYKEKIDNRIDDIIDERFFSGVGLAGLLFRSNGGFRGDMAQVYLLHGEPDAMDVLEGGHFFVNLMLWVYINPENGNILYAFLFYQKGSLGSYVLFSQDSYKMDPCGAIYQVATMRTYSYMNGIGMQGCPDDLNRVYEEIYRARGKGGVLEGYIFAWALFNFSQDGSITQGKALEAPRPASEIAKQSKARIAGEAPKLTGVDGTDYILASCESCNSFIPGEFQLGKEFTLTVRRGDIDWLIVGDKTKSVLKIRLVIESIVNSDQAPLVFEKWATLESSKNIIVSNPTGQKIIPVLTADEVARISAGTYRVSVYVKNVTPGLMTKKYNAWDKQFTK